MPNNNQNQQQRGNGQQGGTISVAAQRQKAWETFKALRGFARSNKEYAPTPYIQGWGNLTVDEEFSYKFPVVKDSDDVKVKLRKEKVTSNLNSPVQFYTFKVGCICETITRFVADLSTSALKAANANNSANATSQQNDGNKFAISIMAKNRGQVALANDLLQALEPFNKDDSVVKLKGSDKYLLCILDQFERESRGGKIWERFRDIGNPQPSATTATAEARFQQWEQQQSQQNP